MKRGFASMDPARLKRVSSSGGKEAQRRGTAHRWREGTAEVKAAAKKSARRAHAIPKKPSVH